MILGGYHRVMPKDIMVYGASSQLLGKSEKKQQPMELLPSSSWTPPHPRIQRWWSEPWHSIGRRWGATGWLWIKTWGLNGWRLESLQYLWVKLCFESFWVFLHLQNNRHLVNSKRMQKTPFDVFWLVCVVSDFWLGRHSLTHEYAW